MHLGPRETEGTLKLPGGPLEVFRDLKHGNICVCLKKKITFVFKNKQTKKFVVLLSIVFKNKDNLSS